MAKKTYKIVRLMPNVSSWCDLENNIYLTKPNKTFKRLQDGCDMKMINKGVKAGLISLEEHIEEVREAKSRARKIPVEPIKEEVVEIKVDVTPVKPVEEVKPVEAIEPQPEEVKEESKKNSDK